MSMRLRVALLLVALTTFLTTALPAAADTASTTSTTQKPTGAPPPELLAVGNRLRLWLLGLSTIAALVVLTYAGIIYLFSGGNPTQVERAKLIVRATAVGYSLMVLAPIVVGALQDVVG